MNYANSKINIFVNNKTYSFSYSHKKDSTFQDLIEYFSYLCPSLNICQCYHFRAAQNNNQSANQYQNISKSLKISDYLNYLNNLQLYPDQKNCQHNNNNNFLLYSKLKLYTAYANQINVLNEKNKEIEELKRKNQLLIQGINGDLEKIKSLQNLGVLNKDFVPRGNLLGINKENNEIQMTVNNDIQKPKFIDFYDVIVHIDSIKDINEGWKIEMSERAKKNYRDYKTQNVLKIGVIGNANKGKSFLLSKISKMDFPSGMSIKTEGLSIKYPDLTLFKNRKIALLDSAGLETPVLILNEKEKVKDKNNEIFKEKSREKLITELFLQNYIINNCDILIVVVDSLSFSEQKLLMKVKKEMERAKIKIPLYIIHNLKTFTSKEQIDEYIKNTLLKSATFTLKPGHNISTKLNNSSEICYYDEICQDKDQKIVHLIYANENSPAGKLYNQYALDYIVNSYQQVSGLQPFDVIESIKERYIKVSKDIKEKTEKEEKLNMDSFDNSDPNIIKLKDHNEIILKKCLTDELGFSNFKANGFEPMYNIYNKDDKIIVRVEAPGNCTLSSKIEIQGEYNVIKLTGEKMKDKEPENLDKNIFNLRENGKYVLEIPLKMGEYRLKNKFKKPEYQRGVYIIEYDLEPFDNRTESVEIPQDKFI